MKIELSNLGATMREGGLMQDVKRKQVVTPSRSQARNVELSDREKAWEDEFAAEGVCLVGSHLAASSVSLYASSEASKR